MSVAPWEDPEPTELDELCEGALDQAARMYVLKIRRPDRRPFEFTSAVLGSAASRILRGKVTRDELPGLIERCGRCHAGTYPPDWHRAAEELPTGTASSRSSARNVTRWP